MSGSGPDPGLPRALGKHGPPAATVVTCVRAWVLPRQTPSALGKDAASYEQIIYEGYAPHGVAVIVECATDNPTRTVASVRMIFSKNGGNLGSTGSVAFQFRKMGVFRLNPEGIDHDDLELYLIDHGLDEMGDSTGEKGEPQIVARCPFADFGKMQEALEKRGITPISAAHEYICTEHPWSIAQLIVE